MLYKIKRKKKSILAILDCFFLEPYTPIFKELRPNESLKASRVHKKSVLPLNSHALQKKKREK